MNVLLTSCMKNKLNIFFLSSWIILSINFNVLANEDDNHAHDETLHSEEDDDDEHIILSENEIMEFDIGIDTAKSGRIKELLTLTGEITLDPDHVIHIVPRVSGITKHVYKTLGDKVVSGELLASLSSRELAEIKAENEAAKSRYELAKSIFVREQKLKNQGLSSESEFLEAKQVRDNAGIAYKLSRQKLRAIGINQKDQDTMQCDDDCDLTLYEIRSPSAGIIIEKHIVQGELLNGENRPFVIANLDRVWVNLNVYQKDLEKIQINQPARVISSHNTAEIESVIQYISPNISKETRSATARVVIDNKNEKWRPGLFVKVEVTVSNFTSDIVIPKTALESINDQTVVFIQTKEGFEPSQVTLGRSDKNNIEVLNGLKTDERYVAKNGFVLKAQMQKTSFVDGHAH